MIRMYARNVPAAPGGTNAPSGRPMLIAVAIRNVVLLGPEIPEIG